MQLAGGLHPLPPTPPRVTSHASVSVSEARRTVNRWVMSVPGEGSLEFKTHGAQGALGEKSQAEGGQSGSGAQEGVQRQSGRKNHILTHHHVEFCYEKHQKAINVNHEIFSKEVAETSRVPRNGAERFLQRGRPSVSSSEAISSGMGSVRSSPRRGGRQVREGRPPQGSSHAPVHSDSQGSRLPPPGARLTRRDRPLGPRVCSQRRRAAGGAVSTAGLCGPGRRLAPGSWPPV